MREMKDSGVEWIGEIPIEWQSRKLFGLLSSVGSGTTPKGDEYYSANGFPWLNTGDLNDGYISETSKFVTEDALRDCSALQIHKAGAVVIAMYGATIGKLGITELDVTTNQACCVMNPSKDLEKKYLFYLLSAAKDFFIYSSYGAGQPNISQNTIKQLKIPYTCIQEQKRIADYLDSKCVKIDSIIEKQQAIIEKLKEYKLSVITEAVTKGLNPNVDMKDSGIRKLNRIPCNWDEIKITRMLDYNCDYPMGDGDHGLIKTDDYKEEGIPYIRVQNLGWGTELSLDNVIYISEEDHEKIKSSELHPNDILFCKTGATIGKTGMIPEGIPIANTTSHVGKITLDKKYNSRFVFYYLSSYIGYVQFWDIACLKSTRPELAIEETKALRIAIPKERNEQDRIVEYLDVKCKDLDLSICKKEKVVEKLQEYKKSLIYEAVTGKKEV